MKLSTLYYLPILPKLTNIISPHKCQLLPPTFLTTSQLTFAVQTARTSINNSYSSISDTASDYGEVNSNRIITVKVFDKNNKLCINITNTYAVEPIFVNNTPVSDKAGHGIGIRSIISVIEKYNGVYDFFTEDGLFYFQACM